MYNKLLVLAIFYIYLPNKSHQVINGVEVEAHSMPYMVAIHSVINGTKVLCGGSLISDRLILTAAKCVYGASEAEVTLGAHDLDKEEDGRLTITSSDFTIHEEYTSSGLFHDIALIQLPKDSVQLSDSINIVQLPGVENITDTYIEEAPSVAGWGKTSDTNSSFSNVLRYQNLTVIPFLACALPYLFQIDVTQLCTSGVSVKNICLGDVGSPLMLNGYQIGIASYGSAWGCAIGAPGVFTRVTSYLGWLLL